MDILKHLRRLEEKIESLFEPGAEPPPAHEGPPPSAPTEPSPASSPPVSASSPQPPTEAPAVTPTPARPTAPARPRHREPLELKKAILAKIEEEIRRIDGRPAFPFNRLDVTLFAADDRARALLEAELIDQDRLEREILRTLETARVTPDRNLALYVRFVGPGIELSPEMQRQGYTLECSREQVTDKMHRPGVSRVRLVVEQGEAEPMELPLDRPRVNIGRLREVVDDYGRVVRRNDLAFLDEGAINATVSRVHAHLSLDSEAGGYRLFDDNSAEGTVLFREGRRVDLLGQRRGVVLRDGDEIYVGQARLRFLSR